MSLSKLVAQREALYQKIADDKKRYEEQASKDKNELTQIDAAIKIASTTKINLERLQNALKYLTVFGVGYYNESITRGVTDERVLRINSALSSAIMDLSKDFTEMRRFYFGVKHYSGWIQRSDHEYGYGPKHGTIQFYVGLKKEAREQPLPESLKDDLIYALINFSHTASLLPS